ncbi:39S ribosomal protein L51, mitochondrial [Nowakowskiella sp. JEL0407]|nr:39S ribosomal protein L51, mitochondrial [Nowakowskiella sp. JEL0407]
MASPKKLLKQLEDAGLKNLLPKPNLRSVAVNGIGAFVFPLQKITFQYDQPRLHSGSRSRGMVKYILNNLQEFAKNHPTVEIEVERRHTSEPKLVATYMYDVVKEVNCGGLSEESIAKNVRYLAETAGFKDTKFVKPVLDARSRKVISPWNPFKAKDTFRP